jgi:N-acetyl-gamma-glutamyl-phosphate reductase
MFISHKKNIAIIGASGYTGAELIRLLYLHPYVTIKYLLAESSAGQKIGAIYPHLAAFQLPDVQHSSEANWDEVEIVFCCLPHGLSQALVAKLPAHIKVIDLSADFRINDIATYEIWYGTHHAPQLQEKAVYGLSEYYREQIKAASLIACPGCYPTCASLPLLPLVAGKIIETEGIIIDAKSGVSGAGRAAKQANLFCEMNENIRPYAINDHRHIPEIEQTLSRAAGVSLAVHFSPQVVPMNRGMLATVYVKLAKEKTLADVRATLEARYRDEYFVTVLPEGQLPSTRDVMGTNRCHIGIAKGRTADRVVLVSVIDNLVKGASGQAVQNFNILLGLPEHTALDLIPVFP